MPKAQSNKTRSRNTTTVDAATTVPDTDDVQPPRPPNSFIVYRSSLCKDMNEQGRMSVLNKMPEAVKADCKDITGFLLSLEERSPRNPGGGKSIGPFAGRWWKAMTPEEKAPWEAKAARLKEEHEVKYPEYKYKPSAPGTKKSGKPRKPRKKAKKEVVALDESTMTMPTLASGSRLPQPIANSTGFDSHAQHPATWYGMSQQPALYERAMHADQQTF
ncbi:hypothetical protein BKA70DRAFT_1345545, partial [Coprinopsis sp. MPI-PUGE-AT-0042]